MQLTGQEREHFLVNIQAEMAVSEASICRKEAAVEPSGTISRRLAKEIPFAEALQNNKYTYAISP